MGVVIACECKVLAGVDTSFLGISSYHVFGSQYGKENNGVLALFSERRNRLVPSTRTTGYVLVFAYYIILNHS